MATPKKSAPHDETRSRPKWKPVPTSEDPTAGGYYCGSRLNKSRPGHCTQRAGWGTDHPREGRCKLHGGSSQITTGRYSVIKRPRIKELMEKLAEDPEPTNLEPEIQLLRALIVDFVERYDEMTEALLAWHESFIKPGMEEYTKPTKILDILSAGKFISEIGVLLEKQAKLKEKRSISLETLERVMEQLGVEVVRSLQEAVEDADARKRALALIEERWSSIRLDPSSGSSRS
ncbi:MAG: hypothetical protein ACYC1U_06810 [Candidatus Aquicultorales bacterium]